MRLMAGEIYFADGFTSAALPSSGLSSARARLAEWAALRVTVNMREDAIEAAFGRLFSNAREMGEFMLDPGSRVEVAAGSYSAAEFAANVVIVAGTDGQRLAARLLLAPPGDMYVEGVNRTWLARLVAMAMGDGSFGMHSPGSNLPGVIAAAGSGPLVVSSDPGVFPVDEARLSPLKAEALSRELAPLGWTQFRHRPRRAA
jgi:hypothetical protein